MPKPAPINVVTVTLNPAIDQTLTISNFGPGKVNRVEKAEAQPAGKGVNVAAALADYGHKVAVTGFVGRGNCDCFAAMFAQRGIEDHFIRIAGETRAGIKIADPVLGQTTDINFPGLTPSASEQSRFFEELDRLAEEDAWFVLSGSLPPGMPAAAYRDMVKIARARGRKVLVDTSGEPLRQALEASPDIIKPNIHELEWLVGAELASEVDALAAARGLLRHGVELVVVSMGEKGAMFVSKETALIARPPRVEVKSTVGAGDAMVAGIVAAQASGLPLEAGARLATAFSLEVLTRGRSGLSAVTAVNQWLGQVAARRME